MGLIPCPGNFTCCRATKPLHSHWSPPTWSLCSTTRESWAQQQRPSVTINKKIQWVLQWLCNIKFYSVVYEVNEVFLVLLKPTEKYSCVVYCNSLHSAGNQSPESSGPGARGTLCVWSNQSSQDIRTHSCGCHPLLVDKHYVFPHQVSSPEDQGQYPIRLESPTLGMMGLLKCAASHTVFSD